MDALKIIIDIVMALIIVLLVILGIKRGLVKSFFRSTKIVFVILLTLLIGSLVVTLCQNLFVNGMFEGKVTEKLISAAQESNGNFNFESVKDETPSIIANIVPMDKMEQHFDSLSGSDTEKASAIGGVIEDALISVVSNVLGYILAFILSFIICSIAIFALEKFFELPVLSWLNHLGGVFWGLANAYLVTSLAVCVVALIFGNEFIEETMLTKIIYNFGLFTL